MPTEPEVLRRLKGLGLDQKTIAAYLGASPASVSDWCNGKKPFEGEWPIEATVLLAVLTEHLAAGGTLATFRHEPGLTLVGETPQRVAEMRIPAAKALEYHKFCDEIRDLPTPDLERASWTWYAQLITEQLSAWLAPVEPRTWQPTARELDTMRRHVEFLHGTLTSLVFRRGQAAVENADA
jgi:hypothetical protein